MSYEDGTGFSLGIRNKIVGVPMRVVAGLSLARRATGVKK